MLIWPWQSIAAGTHGSGGAVCHQLSLESLSVRLKELAAQCREVSINPDLLTGGTITITNLGTFGIVALTDS